MKPVVFSVILSALALCSQMEKDTPSQSSSVQWIEANEDGTPTMHPYNFIKLEDSKEKYPEGMEATLAIHHGKLKLLRNHMSLVASYLIERVPCNLIEDVWYRAKLARPYPPHKADGMPFRLYLSDLRGLSWICGIGLPEEASSPRWNPEHFFTSVREMARAGEALMLKAYQPSDFPSNDLAHKQEQLQFPIQLEDYLLDDHINCILGQNILSYNEASLYKVLGEMARKILETNAHLAAPRGRIHQVLPISKVRLQTLAINRPYQIGERGSKYHRLLCLFVEEFSDIEKNAFGLLFWMYSMKCYLSKDASLPSVCFTEDQSWLYLKFDNMGTRSYRRKLVPRPASHVATSRLNFVFHSIFGNTVPVQNSQKSLWNALCAIQMIFSGRGHIITAKLDSQPAHLYQITAQMCSNISAWPSNDEWSVPIMFENVRSLNFDINSVCCTHKLLDYVSAVLWSAANLSGMTLAFPQWVRFDLAKMKFTAAEAFVTSEDDIVMDEHIFSAKDFAVPPKQ